MKILAIDLETSPIQAYVWSLFNNHSISVDQIITPTSILCWAAKWVGEDEILFSGARGKTSGPEFKAMIRQAHKLLSEADAVLHFNGTSFDIPRLNTQFALLGLPPPPPIPQIDLLKVIQNKFGMTSNKLAFVGPYLKVGEKVKNSGWELWKNCLAGKRDAWAEMEKYNKQDVVLLEKLYKKVLPWIDGHPNQNLFVSEENPVCTNCGSVKLSSNGLRRTTTYVYRRLQCLSCGHWMRGRSRLKAEPTAPVV